MNFENSLKNNYVRKISVSILRAESLIKSSKQAVETAKLIPVNEKTLKTILRELYEGLREYCEAIGYVKGYKFLNHLPITYFLKDILGENSVSLKFERYRKLRNGINYYGNDIEVETVMQALKEIPDLIKCLEKYF